MVVKPSWHPPKLTHRATAYAQVILSILFSVGYFALLNEFIHGHVSVSEKMETVFTTLVTFLTANLGQIIGFWFARQRTSDDPPTAAKPPQ